MYTDMVPKISYQFLIGNVYPLLRSQEIVPDECQFLIGNVYQM